MFRLLITFANSLAPDQERWNVGPDLDQNSLTPKKSNKVNFEKVRRRQRKQKITQHAER